MEYSRVIQAPLLFYHSHDAPRPNHRASRCARAPRGSQTAKRRGSGERTPEIENPACLLPAARTRVHKHRHGCPSAPALVLGGLGRGRPRSPFTSRSAAPAALRRLHARVLPERGGSRAGKHGSARRPTQAALLTFQALGPMTAPQPIVPIIVYHGFKDDSLGPARRAAMYSAAPAHTAAASGGNLAAGQGEGSGLHCPYFTKARPCALPSHMCVGTRVGVRALAAAACTGRSTSLHS
jgi:hypothetical protein